MGTCTYFTSPAFVNPDPLVLQLLKAVRNLTRNIVPTASASGTPGHWWAPMPPGNQLPIPRFKADPANGHFEAGSVASPLAGTHRSGANFSGSGNSDASLFPMRGSAVTTVPAGMRYPASSKSMSLSRKPPPPGALSRSDSRTTPCVNRSCIQLASFSADSARILEIRASFSGPALSIVTMLLTNSDAVSMYAPQISSTIAVAICSSGQPASMYASRTRFCGEPGASRRALYLSKRPRMSETRVARASFAATNGLADFDNAKRPVL
mmetsp:Transcript_45075/g.75889  ORF Transcript_45075/g.75889 Transcript_45075/m.75889 type:complete len:266 (-) Transcript_45075:1053-1850(-)